MIKALIADVDGVMVGKKHGVNFPLPNDLVIQKLKAIHKKGIPIVLCTAKFNYAIQEIIRNADLRNPHIADGGALIIDPLANKIIQKNVFDKNLAEDIISRCIENDIYTECYGVEDYFLQKDQINEFTKKRRIILQKEHKTVASLGKHAASVEIIKIIAFADDKNDKKRIEKVLHPYTEKISFIWTIHPSIVPVQICIITVKGISKKQASLAVLDYLKISPEETLGIGDTLGDWNFMSICRYAATVGDESQELKELAKSKGEGNYFIGSSVDENGIIDILDYFFK